MSVKVLKEAKFYKAECPYCKSVLQFEREDIEDRFPCGIMVHCPVCDKGIEVGSNSEILFNSVEPTYKDES